MLKALPTQVFLQVGPEKSSLHRVWLADGADIHTFLGTFHKMSSWIIHPADGGIPAMLVPGIHEGEVLWWAIYGKGDGGRIS